VRTIGRSPRMVTGMSGKRAIWHGSAFAVVAPRAIAASNGQPMSRHANPITRFNNRPP